MNIVSTIMKLKTTLIDILWNVDLKRHRRSNTTEMRVAIINMTRPQFYK